MPNVSEHMVVTALAVWMREEYPWLPFRFDLAADMPLPMKYARRNGQLHGKAFTKGHPDLTIYRPGGKPYFLEIKKGKVPNNEHTETQRAYHDTLRALGYEVDFGEGLTDCKERVKRALDNKKTKKFLALRPT